MNVANLRCSALARLSVVDDCDSEVDEEHGLDGFVVVSGYYGWPGPDVPLDVLNEGTLRWFGSAPAIAQPRGQDGAAALEAMMNMARTLQT
jgi:hypothetical protein